jgi:hypothetical protein
VSCSSNDSEIKTISDVESFLEKVEQENKTLGPVSKQIEGITEQLKGEINIKTIEFLDDANSLLVKEVIYQKREPLQL